MHWLSFTLKKNGTKSDRYSGIYEPFKSDFFCLKNTKICDALRTNQASYVYCSAIFGQNDVDLLCPFLALITECSRPDLCSSIETY